MASPQFGLGASLGWDTVFPSRCSRCLTWWRWPPARCSWSDLVGLAPDDPKQNDKVGLLLVAEAHLEYNAGPVISTGSRGPITSQSGAKVPAEELADCRQLLAMARPPINPTDCSQGATMYGPCMAVSCAKHGYCPIHVLLHRLVQEELPFSWPKKAHPGALSEAGQERTPWLTRWARATFEQGCLSVLPHLEETCKALSLPGEHLFQAGRIPNRMRPVIFHASFGKAKKDAPKVLEELAQLGWETLPIALLGMPHYPAAWVVDAWKPIGGCFFTGSPTALAGNSAFRFCLLMQWQPQVADPHHGTLHPGPRCGACSTLAGNKLRALGSTALAGSHGLALPRV